MGPDNAAGGTARQGPCAALAAQAGGPHITAPMRILCPQCQAAYDVPDRLIAGGRLLRCVKCRHEWREEAGGPPPPPPAPEPAPPRPVPPPIPAQHRAHQPIDPPEPARRGGLALAAAWAASGLVLAGFIAAMLAYRAPIAEAWPPAARLYLLLGLG
jgi:predicted Zn finger-like uncharacterized protein